MKLREGDYIFFTSKFSDYNVDTAQVLGIYDLGSEYLLRLMREDNLGKRFFVLERLNNLNIVGVVKGKEIEIEVEEES